MAEIIRQTGLPNYRAARFPIKSGLNIEAWEKYLKDYPDKHLIQYLKFGFPLSIKDAHTLNNTSISNHFLATAFPAQVSAYIHKEISLGAMLGPMTSPPCEGYHCSPLLTRPKDGDKRRVILNLSYPKGASVNDLVDRQYFDHSEFALKFPTVEEIAKESLKFGTEAFLAKVDVARAFRYLRVDPADALKFGIKWQDQYFLDIGVTFGWVHGSSAFQMVSDAVTYVMAKRHHRIFAYIDDYIIVGHKDTATRAFNNLLALLDELGLPISTEKFYLTTEFFRDLAWFCNFLGNFNGISFIDKTVIPHNHTLHVDASLTGLGGIWCDRVYATPIIPFIHWDLKIVHLEMLNLLVAIRKWKHCWSHSKVKVHCNNMAIVQVVGSGKTKDPYLAACLRNLWLLTATYDIELVIEHIQGKKNVVADLLSRLYSRETTDIQLLSYLKITISAIRLALMTLKLTLLYDFRCLHSLCFISGRCMAENSPSLQTIHNYSTSETFQNFSVIHCVYGPSSVFVTSHNPGFPGIFTSEFTLSQGHKELPVIHQIHGFPVQN